MTDHNAPVGEPIRPFLRLRVRGLVMTDKLAHYRQCAEHCQRMADEASCQEQKAFLMEAVRSWRLLEELHKLHSCVERYVTQPANSRMTDIH